MLWNVMLFSRLHTVAPLWSTNSIDHTLFNSHPSAYSAAECGVHFLNHMHPHGAAPLHTALLQKHNQAVGMGNLFLDHGHDVLGHAVCFPLAGLEDESRRVY